MATDSLAGRIAGEIISKVRSGELAPGAHLRAQSLADEYGVSRSPIREAFELLEKSGFVKHIANRGFFVQSGEIAPGELETPASSSVYFQLARDWLRDEIPADITERFLHRRYGLTKMQAVSLLSRATQEGWAEVKAGQGWRLLDIVKTASAYEQLYRFRATIESTALLEPTFRPDRSVIAKQRSIIDRILAGGITEYPAERVLRLGIEFHETIAGLSGNEFYCHALVRVNKMRLLMEYNRAPDTEITRRQWEEHAQILDYIEQGDAIAAAYAMREHLSHVRSRVVDHFAAFPDTSK